MPDVGSISYCGYYIHWKWYCWGWIRVGVSPDGLALTQTVVPHLFFIRVFVPWPDTVMKEGNTDIRLGFTQAPETEIRLDKVVLSKMQHCLRKRVPFGHVV